jgi:chemosensory pili system protein ChpA (sensor histidine kinase/response regulator)
MSSNQLQAFIEEAESFLLMIRNGILLCSQEGNLSGELETALRYTQAFKDGAATVGLSDIANYSEKLEFDLVSVISANQSLTDFQTRNLLDKLAQIEAVLTKLHFSTEDFSDNLDGFLEESFDNLWLEESKETSATEEFVVEESETSIDAADELEGFEIDEEMLEIFAEEAEDLLRNIQTNLKTLESAPNNRDALLEIRRNAHTLKGSAGIVGLKPLSNLAHRVEDLLDFISDNEIEGNEKVFELLMTSTDCLSALASGENLAQLSNKISLLYQNFDETLNALKLEDEWEKSIKEPKMQVQKQIVEDFVEIVQAESEPEQKTQEAAQPAKSVVRVSIEKLDELVRLVSDLVISRSFVEQRLSEFAKQISELQHSTERLKKSTSKLETDFEASMLGGNVFGLLQNPQFGSRSPQSFDALEFDHYTEFHQTTRELLETTGDTSAINGELENLRSNLELIFEGQSHLLEQLQDKLLRLRMVRFGSLSARLHRTVRVTCEQENKQAELFIEGETAEVDTQILDALVEPLLHLLRNAVAHGIESPDTRRLLGKPEKGGIRLKIHNEGTHIILTIFDDGRGISTSALKEKAVRNGFISPSEAEKMTDEEAFSLCFLAGLTTAEQISQTAGRGVGMNIIKTNILRQQGTISIASEPQKSTTFTIRLPMALAVTRGLLIKSGGQTFVFPIKLVKKVSEIPAEQFKASMPQKSLQIGGSDYTVSHLNKLLGKPVSESKREQLPILLLEISEKTTALIVEEVLHTEEIVIKPFGTPLQNFPYLLGATILGDGSVVPVLDLIYLFNNRAQNTEVKAQNQDNNDDWETESGDSQLAVFNPQLLKVMIVDDSPSVRHIMSKLIKNAGWEVVTAKDGLEALDALHNAETLPDVVLTDVEMPRLNGYELLASIRKEELLQQLPVVMITSRANEKHHQKAVELGVSEYLTKPFDDAVLIETIKKLTTPIAV